MENRGQDCMEINTLACLLVVMERHEALQCANATF